MAAVQKVEVLAYEVKSGTSKKSGSAYSIPEAQCVLHGEDGSKKVGVLNLPKDHPAVKPGMYTPTFKVVCGFDGKMFGSIDTLIPLKP